MPKKNDDLGHKAYVFRIYPNAEQKVLLAKTFGCVRWVYNHWLDIRKAAYTDNKESVSYNKCSQQLTDIKKAGYEYNKARQLMSETFYSFEEDEIDNNEFVKRFIKKCNEGGIEYVKSK